MVSDPRAHSTSEVGSDNLSRFQGEEPSDIENNDYNSACDDDGDVSLPGDVRPLGSPGLLSDRELYSDDQLSNSRNANSRWSTLDAGLYSESKGSESESIDYKVSVASKNQ